MFEPPFAPEKTALCLVLEPSRKTQSELWRVSSGMTPSQLCLFRSRAGLDAISAGSRSAG